MKKVLRNEKDIQSFRKASEQLVEAIERMYEQAATSGEIDKLMNILEIVRELRDMPRPIFPELLLKRTYGE